MTWPKALAVVASSPVAAAAVLWLLDAPWWAVFVGALVALDFSATSACRGAVSEIRKQLHPPPGAVATAVVPMFPVPQVAVKRISEDDLRRLMEGQDLPGAEDVG